MAAQRKPRSCRGRHRPAPPFCPNERCDAHGADARERGWRAVRRGGRRVARSAEISWRFTCPWCRRSFSSSIFGPDYRCRIAGLAGRVYHHLCEGQSERQAARNLGVSPGAVRRRRRYLGRQSVLIQVELLGTLPAEAIGRVELDGFRTFAMSQYEPLDLNTLVLSEPGLVLDLDAAPLRRSGRMTARQRVVRAAREARLGRPRPGARRRSVERLLRRLAGRLPEGSSLELASDEEPSYRRALGVVRGRLEVTHVTVSSKVPRDASGHPLWQTNHLHRLLRHARADHKRETLSFAKRLQGLMDRAWITAVWRNLTKGISERTGSGSRTTPAMRAGLAARPLCGEELFAQRRFPRIVGLPRSYRTFYDGRLRARPNETIAA